LRRHWRLAAVLLVQAGILAAMVGRHAAARAWGTAITLRTAPVDPYDILSGYHLVLEYEVENVPEALLPGGLGQGDRLWLVVRRAEPARELVAATRERPDPAPDRVALPARWDSWRRARIEGADRVYIPETERARAEKLFRDAGGRGLVDMRVGDDGTVALLRLRVGGASFGD
jgi:hypothetical protein